MQTEASPNETRLPRAVRAQMQRVNERLEAKPAAANPPPPDASEAAPAVTEPENPSGSAPQPSPADPRENDPAYWRQRFSVTQGMLRRLQEDQAAASAERDREITELREKVRSLEANSSANDKPDVATFFTPEQIERFGEDQCEAMAATAIKAAREQAQSLIDAEVRPLRERAQADAQRVHADREAVFWEQLAEAVPDYAEVNATDEWLTWLAEHDDATGLVRQDILDRHRGALNAAGVAKVFQGFKASRSRPTPPVAPPRNAATGAGAVPAANEPAKGYPSRDEIREFYKRAAIGRVTDKERVEFEARLRSKAAA